jgi:hypothetical protein
MWYSLGNSAVFLIGGLTRSVEPVPILLRSGDVIVMSGPGCRRAYHGELCLLFQAVLPSDISQMLRSRSATNTGGHVAYASTIRRQREGVATLRGISTDDEDQHQRAASVPPWI